MSFTDTWLTAKVNDGDSNTDPPDEGSFDVILTTAGAFTSKDGKDLVKLELRVLEGEHTGYEWTEFRNFGSQGAANAAKTTCFRLGIAVDQIAAFTDLDAELKMVAGNNYLVKVVRNGEYLNCYFEGRLASIPTDTQPPTADPTPTPAQRLADEDIPF
jgi:hypothetical protein